MVYCGLYAELRGLLTYILRPLDPNKTTLLSSDHKVLRHFETGQSACVFAKCNLATTCLFFKRGTFLGLLATNLRTVLEETLKFKSSLIWWEVTKGSATAARFINLSSCSVFFLFSAPCFAYIFPF